jgi:predicted nucleic acid-binding protein
VIFVIDASVAVKWFVEEDGHDEACDLLEDGIVRLAPDLVFTEVANALRKKLNAREITLQQAQAALADLAAYVPRIIPSEALAQDALLLAAELNHPVADCMYLACAKYTGAKLVSADEKFVAKCEDNHRWFVQSLAKLRDSILCDLERTTFAPEIPTIVAFTRLLAIYLQCRSSIIRNWFKGDAVDSARQRLVDEVSALDAVHQRDMIAVCWLGSLDVSAQSDAEIHAQWVWRIANLETILPDGLHDRIGYIIMIMQHLEAGLPLLSRLYAYADFS